MEFNIQAGTQGQQTQTVSAADTAVYFGSGLIEVYATPAMIALMEKTAQLSIQPFLPEGFISLGTEISASHIKPTLVGETVRCESILKSSEGNKMLFSIKVWNEKELIGEAIHRRYIVNALKFMDKLVGEDED